MNKQTTEKQDPPIISKQTTDNFQNWIMIIGKISRKNKNKKHYISDIHLVVVVKSIHLIYNNLYGYYKINRSIFWPIWIIFLAIKNMKQKKPTTTTTDHTYFDPHRHKQASGGGFIIEKVYLDLGAWSSSCPVEKGCRRFFQFFYDPNDKTDSFRKISS